MLHTPPEQLTQWHNSMWRPWYAALWAEAAVLAGRGMPSPAWTGPALMTADNPIATAIVDRAAALAQRRRPRRVDRRGRRPAGGRMPLPVGQNARPHRRGQRARGEAVLAAMGATLWPGLQNDVERGLGRPAHVGEPGLAQHGGEPAFTGLRAQSEPDLLRQRARRADHRGQAVEVRPTGFRLSSSPSPAFGSTSSSVPSGARACRMRRATPTGSPMSCRASNRHTRS